jgi:HTH-like domain
VSLSFVRFQFSYEAVKTLSRGNMYPVWKLCNFLHITRSAYYSWLSHPKSDRELENEQIASEVEKIHNAHPDMGYRRIRDELDRNHGIRINDKRVLRKVRHLRNTLPRTI